jgi:hypothetical protein
MFEEIIPRQNFENARDAIAGILLGELSNQKEIQGFEFEEDILIYAERSVPIQNDELLTINISLDSINYNSKSQNDLSGIATYNIDIYTVGQASKCKHGWTDSSYRLHKFLGMVRYILSHTKYKTLSLPLGIIGGTQVESLTVADFDSSQDTNYVRMGRLVFSVRLIESQSMEAGVPLSESLTSVKLHETELGFVYQFNN